MFLTGSPNNDVALPNKRTQQTEIELITQSNSRFASEFHASIIKPSLSNRLRRLPFHLMGHSHIKYILWLDLNFNMSTAKLSDFAILAEVGKGSIL